MGTYLNPGNESFKSILRDVFVDKSGLISLINDCIDTPRRLFCISRPRRFGKSYAAKMLCAYYDRSCDSRDLFTNLAIARTPNFDSHLNAYNVIYLDMAGLLQEARDEHIVEYIEKLIRNEIQRAFPEIQSATALNQILVEAAEAQKTKFIMIIDEWDAPIREQREYEKDYLKFLRMLFKNSATTDRVFAAAYMTGILPIKKEGTQSALSDFNEYSMIDPQYFADFVGFTDQEVRELCTEYDQDYELIKQWYDGYHMSPAGAIYNPNSVIKAVTSGKYKSYWTQSSITDNLFDFISMDFAGLSKTITEIIGGGSVRIDPYDFSNDLNTFDGANSVLVALVHLGYLAYDGETESVYIPNDEVRIEFTKSLHKFKGGETLKRVKDSHQLIMDTVNGNTDAVAAQIEKIHEEETAALFYNNEQALRGIIKLAYFAYRDYYIKFEELPAGSGYADIVYFPKKDTTLPALLIELKWDRSAVGAIQQIKDRHYPSALENYGGELLLVGINYDKQAPAGKRQHSCRIERM